MKIKNAFLTKKFLIIICKKIEFLNKNFKFKNFDKFIINA